MPVPNMRNCKVGSDLRAAPVMSPRQAGKKYATRREGETSEPNCSAMVGYMPCQISLGGPHESGRLAAAVALNGWEASSATHQVMPGTKTNESKAGEPFPAVNQQNQRERSDRIQVR